LEIVGSRLAGCTCADDGNDDDNKQPRCRAEELRNLLLKVCGHVIKLESVLIAQLMWLFLSHFHPRYRVHCGWVYTFPQVHGNVMLMIVVSYPVLKDI
jgi:hypothetical protein